MSFGIPALVLIQDALAPFLPGTFIYSLALLFIHWHLLFQSAWVTATLAGHLDKLKAQSLPLILTLGCNYARLSGAKFERQHKQWCQCTQTEKKSQFWKHDTGYAPWRQPANINQ